MAYSKNRVDRAGRTLSEFVVAATQGSGVTIDHLTEVEIAEAREARTIVEWWRRTHAQPLSRVAANLRYYAAEHGRPRVTQRLKRLPTIAEKLVRERCMKLSRMADIGGVRAVLPDQDAAYQVAGRLRHNWTIAQFRDYVSDPKPDGYRALHLINRHRGRLVEVQLRTPRQDMWANAVEADARLFPALKSGGGPTELRAYYVAIAELLARRDAGEPFDEELLDRVERLEERADTFRRKALE